MTENAELRADIVRLETEVRYLTQEFTEFRHEHSELLEAWRAGTGFFRFLKWFLSLAGAAAMLWAAITQIRWS